MGSIVLEVVCGWRTDASFESDGCGMLLKFVMVVRYSSNLTRLREDGVRTTNDTVIYRPDEHITNKKENNLKRSRHDLDNFVLRPSFPPNSLLTKHDGIIQFEGSTMETIVVVWVP